ncbi:MAG: HD domain-containing protein [Candidatus Aenigmarchaeota archaeon]|nr:HD domain-containing protein [Candidatus Aenigmarchaeota archaeon]
MKSLERFFEFIYKLKKLKRSGWVKKAKIRNVETVASHSYGVALLSMILSDLKGYDTEKVLKMALLHDLPESLTGDFMPEEISKLEKTSEENEAMEKILSTLSKNLREEYSKVWKELQEGKSKEAKLVRKVDKLDMKLQALFYSKEFKEKKKLLKEFLNG